MPRLITHILSGVITYSLGMNIAMAAGAPMTFNDSLICYVLGLTGAACVSAWLERIDNTRRTYAALLLSMLIAGIFSPPIAKAITTLYGQQLGINESDLTFVIPLLIGVIVPFAIPLGAVYFTNKYGSKGGEGNSNAS